MLCRYNYTIVLIIFLWSIIDARLLSPFDIRIDHDKVDTTDDLIINTPRPRFSWKISVSNDILQRNIRQQAYQIQLESIKLIEQDHFYRWDSQQIISSQSIHVPYMGNADLLPSTYYRLRLRVWTTDSDESSEWTRWIKFRTAIFNLHEYLTNNVNSIWIGSTKINMNELRKEFEVPGISAIKSAIIYISGLGYYELYLNGKNIDPSRKLDPGWTTYERRTLFASFDVTDSIEVRDIFFFFSLKCLLICLNIAWYECCRCQTR
jgi:alpha-L-rhamnosidase